ncbi:MULTISPECIES: Rop family plasmid primer RNA-binding protein [Proteus]|uniref:Rop family plasmid primer RNA-binding protein n=1 Tax=Proteus TaxID=583 RepID=UPI0021DA90FC|nr:Rop family plasmid primer RNA-binding protein [Proteus mirabilis]MCU9582495.1 Rop family plasmid primer RNA-binding protein [Proteus mirabilis]
MISKQQKTELNMAKFIQAQSLLLLARILGDTIPCLKWCSHSPSQDSSKPCM